MAAEKIPLTVRTIMGQSAEMEVDRGEDIIALKARIGRELRLNTGQLCLLFGEKVRIRSSLISWALRISQSFMAKLDAFRDRNVRRESDSHRLPQCVRHAASRLWTAAWWATTKFTLARP